MSTLQIRSVPEEISRTLKARAAKAGMSLSEYALRELTRSAQLPTFEEINQRIADLGPVELKGSSIAELVREDRDGR